MIYNLIYTSNRTKECTDEEIKNILALSRKNNQRIGVTGVLLYSDSYFVQYLEGEWDQIFGLYDKIKQDIRHQNPFLVSVSFATKRLFHTWQMGTKRFDDADFQLESFLENEHIKEFDKIMNSREVEEVRSIRIIRKLFNSKVNLWNEAIAS